MPHVMVDLGKRSYPVLIESPAQSQIPGRLAKRLSGNRVFAFYDARVYALHRKSVSSLLKGNGQVIEFVVPPGERSKSQAQLTRIYAFLLSERISRADTVIACGGGVVSDLIGYAAATTMRGIPWMVIPTTLVGMVDAAIGGKTAINHPSGKNLIGAFWQPSLVYCDPRYLLTLPHRHIINGLGEVLKYAGLIGRPMTAMLSSYLRAGNIYDLRKLNKIIADSVRYKAAIVTSDETDMDRRKLLNLGHTFAHAIEMGAGYGRLLHGEAVILGLKAAVHLSILSDRRCAAALREYSALIDSFIPLLPRCRIDVAGAMRALRLDKKRTGLAPKFILLKELGRPIIAEEMAMKSVRKSLQFALTDRPTSGGFDD